MSMDDLIVMENSSLYKRTNLENRLIDFALSIRDLLIKLANDEFTRVIKNQLSRSSTSPAFNYGEAQSAESRKDFIHKLGICLKELRETFVGLKFIERGNYCQDIKFLELLMKENNELISIFMKSIETARKNLKKE